MNGSNLKLADHLSKHNSNTFPGKSKIGLNGKRVSVRPCLNYVVIATTIEIQQCTSYMVLFRMTGS